jgi:hypothetical protein
VTVNAFSSLGKFGYSQKLINTTRLAYSEFSLPQAITNGDVINIPVTLYNQQNTSVDLEYTVTEKRDGSNFINSIQNNTVIGAMSSIIHIYRIVTSASSIESRLSLNVEMKQANKLLDSYMDETKMIYNVYPVQSTKTNVFQVAQGALPSEIIESFEFPATMVGTPKFKAAMFSTTF